MSALSLLKQSCNNKPFVSFEDLAVGDYYISSFALVQSKFGLRIRVDIGNRVVLLPERFTKTFTEEHIKELNQGEYIMIYKGKEPTTKKLILDFEMVDSYPGPFFTMK